MYSVPNFWRWSCFSSSCSFVQPKCLRLFLSIVRKNLRGLGQDVLMHSCSALLFENKTILSYKLNVVLIPFWLSSRVAVSFRCLLFSSNFSQGLDSNLSGTVSCLLFLNFSILSSYPPTWPVLVASINLCMHSPMHLPNAYCGYPGVCCYLSPHSFTCFPRQIDQAFGYIASKTVKNAWDKWRVSSCLAYIFRIWIKRQLNL
jgi:hypothetical protein